MYGGKKKSCKLNLAKIMEAETQMSFVERKGILLTISINEVEVIYFVNTNIHPVCSTCCSTLKKSTYIIEFQAAMKTFFLHLGEETQCSF